MSWHRFTIAVIVVGAALPSLAACGSRDSAAPSESGVKNGRENPAVAADVAPDEPETLVGKFIATEGKHVVDSAGEFEIHVVREGDLLNYSVRIRTATPRPPASEAEATALTKNNTTTGPKNAAIDPNSDWFIYVESESRYWVFDGSARVTLFEYSGSPRSSKVTMTDLESGPDRLLAEMPCGVKNRIPPAVLAEGK